MLMEYPNRNIQYVINQESERAKRDFELFGDTLHLSSPERRFITPFNFSNYADSAKSLLRLRK